MPLDFSITKNVAAMMVAAAIGMALFISLGRSYRKTGVSEPRGLQGFLEPIILFVRDDIALPNVGEHKYEKYLPYLLTVFFFILINNIFGLIPFFPFGANVTGNIAVTFVLASFTFLVTQFSGNRSYWRHVFATPGVPVWLLPVMIIVELIGLIAKPFALMVRLFANITAGHIIIMGLVSIIFIFKTLWVLPGAVIFVLFMDFLELLVAFLQAYVFTLLSALFIGMAVEEHH
jgi:F-type H+-transporting ATPase subunit a